MKKIRIVKREEIHKTLGDIRVDYKALILENVYGNNTQYTFDSFYEMHKSLNNKKQISSNIEIVLINELGNYIYPILAKDKDKFKIKLNLHNVSEGVINLSNKDQNIIYISNKKEAEIKGISVSRPIKDKINIFSYKYFRSIKPCDLLFLGSSQKYLYKNSYLPIILKMRQNIIKKDLTPILNNIFIFKKISESNRIMLHKLLKYIYAMHEFYDQNHLAYFNLLKTNKFQQMIDNIIKKNYINSLDNVKKVILTKNKLDSHLKKILDKYENEFTHKLCDYNYISLIIQFYNNKLMGINHIFDIDPSNKFIKDGLRNLDIIKLNKKSLFLIYNSFILNEYLISLKNRLIRHHLKSKISYNNLSAKDKKFIDEEFKKITDDKKLKLDKSEYELVKYYSNIVNLSDIPEEISDCIKKIESISKEGNLDTDLKNGWFIKNKNNVNLICTHYIELGKLIIEHANKDKSDKIIKNTIIKKYVSFTNDYDINQNDFYCKYCGALIFYKDIEGFNVTTIMNNNLYNSVDSKLFTLLTSKTYKIITKYIKFKIKINKSIIVRQIIHYIKDSFNKYLELLEVIKDEAASIKNSKIQVHLSIYIHSCIILFILNDNGIIMDYKDIFATNFKKLKKASKNEIKKVILKYLKHTLQIILVDENYNMSIANLDKDIIEKNYTTIFNMLNNSNIKLLKENSHKIRKTNKMSNNVINRIYQNFCCLDKIKNKSKNECNKEFNINDFNNLINKYVISKHKNSYKFLIKYISDKKYFKEAQNNLTESKLRKEYDQIMHDDNEVKIVNKIRNLKPFYNFNWLPSISKYYRYSADFFQLEDLYCPDGKKHKFNILIYKIKNKEFVLTNNKMKMLISNNDPILKNIKKNEYYDLQCSNCDIRLTQIKYNTNISEILKKKEDLLSFFEYYENRCPEGQFHIYKNNVCTKCKIKYHNLVTKNDKQYYKKYYSKYADDKKEKLKMQFIKYDKIFDRYKITKKYILKEKEEFKNLNESNIAKLKKLLDINYNQIINIGLSREDHYDNIINGISNPHESKEVKSYRQIILLEYIQFLLNFINQLYQFKSFGTNILYNEFISTLIKDNIITINDIIIEKDLNYFYNNFYKKKSYYINYLSDKDFNIFLLNELINILFRLDNYYINNKMKGKTVVIRTIMNYIIKKEELREKPRVKLTDKNESLSFLIDDDDYEDFNAEQKIKELESGADQTYQTDELDLGQGKEFDDDENTNATIAEL